MNKDEILKRLFEAGHITIDEMLFLNMKEKIIEYMPYPYCYPAYQAPPTITFSDTPMVAGGGGGTVQGSAGFAGATPGIMVGSPTN